MPSKPGILAEIKDRGAVLEWSPFTSRQSLVAIGTKDSAGAGFDEYGGELELYDLDFSQPASTPTAPIASVAASSRFSSLAWSKYDIMDTQYPLGFIAGGMADGSINIWDPQALCTKEEGIVLNVESHHNGPVTGLQFNPHAGWTHSLASGGADMEVLVMNLERLDAPVTYTASDTSKHAAEVTKVAWNTGTHYILASSDSRGSCCVWDMKSRKMWCEIRDPQGGMISDIAWSPEGGTRLVTASGDDRNPVIKYWDLRSSTSMPVTTLKGHEEGLLSVSWCPNDPSLLMSTGKDNRTIMWDLVSCKPVYDLPNDTSASPGGSGLNPTPEIAGDFFGGGQPPIGGGHDKRYQATWSPTLPAVAATCSFDRKVHFHSLSGFKSSTGRAPKWLRRPVGASFSFGGKLVTFDNKGDNNKNPVVQVKQVVEDHTLITACDTFHLLMASGDFKGLCDAKAAEATNSQEIDTWKLMKVICFEASAREELQKYLGFDSEEIMKLVTAAVPSLHAHSAEAGDAADAATMEPTAAVKASSSEATPAFASNTASLSPSAAAGGADLFSAPPASADDIFGGNAPAPAPAPALTPASAPAPAPAPRAGTLPPVEGTLPASAADVDMSAVQATLRSLPGGGGLADQLEAAGKRKAEFEAVIRRALVVGNFGSAVDCCIEAGMWPEALLLAQCGDQPLWLRTQAAFFDSQKAKLPFLSILNSIIKNELMGYVKTADLDNWKETLAVLSTYGKSDEFPEMCETLASRLENEKANFFASTLCCMCAASVTRVVAFWTAELEAANKAKGGMDTQALQRYVEKVVVFTHANPGTPVGDDQAKNFATYAALLAAQGRVAEAPRYLKDTKEPDQVLINRLYHGGSKPAGASVPVFPFTKVEVKYCETAISEAEKRKKEAEAKAAAEKKAKEEEAARLLLERQREEAAAAAATAAAAAPTLPPGWSQNVDPRSGKTYYISPNNTSQWDPPPLPMAPVPAPAPSPAVSVNSMQPVGGSFAQPGYGGALGVGAGASMTALASQGGGVGTSTAAPTTATATSTAGNGAPAVVTVNNEAVTGLRAIIEGLQAVATPAEKRQLSMIMGCQNSLEEQVAAGAVANDTLASVAAIVSHINNKDFAMATSMQGDMAKNPPIWSAHSSWLKGLKMLIPIAKKK